MVIGYTYVVSDVQCISYYVDHFLQHMTLTSSISNLWLETEGYYSSTTPTSMVQKFGRSRLPPRLQGLAVT